MKTNNTNNDNDIKTVKCIADIYDIVNEGEQITLWGTPFTMKDGDLIAYMEDDLAKASAKAGRVKIIKDKK